jgi:hypothetical protein
VERPLLIKATVAVWVTVGVVEPVAPEWTDMAPEELVRGLADWAALAVCQPFRVPTNITLGAGVDTISAVPQPFRVLVGKAAAVLRAETALQTLGAAALPTVGLVGLA